MSENRKDSIQAKFRQAAVGTVVSDKMNKTLVVRIDRVTRHRIYGKVTRRSSRVKVHDEKNAAKTGNVVKIVMTRPLSKDKRWKLVEIVNPVRKGGAF